MKACFSLLRRRLAGALAWLASFGIISQPLLLGGILASMVVMPAPAEARYCTISGLSNQTYTLSYAGDQGTFYVYPVLYCTSGSVGVYICGGVNFTNTAALSGTVLLSFSNTSGGSSTQYPIYAGDTNEYGSFYTGYGGGSSSVMYPTTSNPVTVNNYMQVFIQSPTGNFINLTPGTYTMNMNVGLDLNGSGTCDSWSATVAGTASLDSGYQTVTYTIVVPSFCGINSTTGVAFGTVSQTTTATNAQGSVTTLCNQSGNYTVSIGNGNNYSGGRRMVSGSNYLPYKLYTNAARTTEWTSGTTVSTATAGSGASATTQIYGQIPAGTALPPAGSYSDTVTVTISY